MNIPPELVVAMNNGQVVLLLGAGASIGATNPDGSNPPLGEELRDLIAARYLDGDYSKENLGWVAELAISRSNLYDVQDFIADHFRELIPASFHGLLPEFKWRGIATTNFDRLIEITYEQCPKPVQRIVPFLSDKDRVDQKLRDPSALRLLKLHGCITRTHDEKLPLILTIEQFATYRRGRIRLFNQLLEWGSENPIVFVGHRLQDINLRAIIQELTELIPSRPRFYLVRPVENVHEVDLWGERRITVLDGSFEDFLVALDKVIGKDVRPLLGAIDLDHPIRKHFITRREPSPSLIEFLSNDAEYVHENMPSGTGSPSKFYSGFNLNWFPIHQNLDVRREMTDKLLFDVVLRPESDRPSRTELYLIKAEAGAGKSVALLRLAWEAATQAEAICLRFIGHDMPNYEALRELSEATGQRIFFFIDNAVHNQSNILGVIAFAKTHRIPITIVTTERVNEWNVGADDLESYLSDEYRLPYLNRSEIETLVNLLTEHHSLGPNLTGKTFDQCVEEFEKRAGRQLLVALLEATQGELFEDILVNEYERIVPPEAQKLYLSVCVLNRLRVPVRAGLISRVHSIPFEDFQKRLFKPLEHVVNIVTLPWGDYAYCARHPEIARTVFERILTDPIERFNEYIRIIKALNPMYSVDNDAVRGMMRARPVHELFPSYEDAKAIFNAFEETVTRNPYFLQQLAIYESVRPNGNLSLAQNYLIEAIAMEPRDSTIAHTLAEILRKRAAQATKPLERLKLRSEASSVLGSIGESESTDSYILVTKLKLTIDNMRDLLSNDPVQDRELDDVIRQAERLIAKGKQNHPGEKHLLIAEAEFAKLVEDDIRSVEALRKANKANPRDPYIASRLSNILLAQGKTEDAKKCIYDALESDRSNRRLNFQYAEILRKLGTEPIDGLIYYYQRAFTKWDDNYESQFWFARFAFESSNPKHSSNSKEVFRNLREVPIHHEERIKIKDTILENGEPKIFSGAITRLEATHGFVEIDGRGDWLFFHESDLSEDSRWASLLTGGRVLFQIGFSLKGPKAFALRLEGSR